MTDHTNTNWPTAGFSSLSPQASSEAHELQDALTAYLETAPDDETSVERLVSQVLWEHRRDQFVAAHDLSQPAETACLARLIDGRDECPHHPVGDDDDPNAPPHSPPAGDHATLWLDDDDEPAVYSYHPYQGDLEHPVGGGNQWFDIAAFAREFGLELGVRQSWFNTPSTIQILLYPPERYRSADE